MEWQEMKMKLYGFQSTAVRNTVKEFKRADRAKVIMPCGTGKSLVGVHIVKKMTPKRSLIVAPSLALVKQLLDTYAEQGGLQRVIVVCSDDSTAKEAREKFEIPGVTTDAKFIAAELRKRSGIMVFSTYQSSPKIAAAFADGNLPAFDLAVFDEAHHMAGGSKIFTTALDDDRIKIRKRLFMTATPRVATQSAKDQATEDGYEFASMDDETQFGRETFYMSFNTAIDGDHLTDYQVAIFVVKESEIQSMVDSDEDAKETAKRVALIRAMQEHDIRKVLAYHRSVRQMNWFADIGLRKTFDAFKESDQVTGSLWSGALDGADPVCVRRSTLNHFAGLNGDSRAVLNNCKVLQEGVDCPAVDAVCLIEPRTQPVDIVQIVGRAIRKSANKKIATIILPVFMPKGVEEDVETFIKSSDFAPVWDVIAAIRSHDDRVQGWVSSAGSFSGSASKSHIKFNINLPSGIQGKFYEAIESRIVKRFHEPMRLTEDLIWRLMQVYRKKHKTWPTRGTEEVTPYGKWPTIDSALRSGVRGLPGGSSLRKLLKTHNVDVYGSLLTEEGIWAMMVRYFEKHKTWPNSKAHAKETTPQGTWRSIDAAMYCGHRGLPGGSSLANLRIKMLNESTLLTEDLVWKMMEEHFEKHKQWPTQQQNDQETPHGQWMTIDRALHDGARGLPGGSSLSKLRTKMRGEVAVVTEELICEWMQDYFQKHTEWPNPKTKGETLSGTWHAINEALRKGRKGLSGGSSLDKLRKKILNVPDTLTEELIWEWMQDYHKEHNMWPTQNTKQVTKYGTWQAVSTCLSQGICGLPGGSSLAKLRDKMLATQPAE